MNKNSPLFPVYTLVSGKSHSIGARGKASTKIPRIFQFPEKIGLFWSIRNVSIHLGTREKWHPKNFRILEYTAIFWPLLEYTERVISSGHEGKMTPKKFPYTLIPGKFLSFFEYTESHSIRARGTQILIPYTLPFRKGPSIKYVTRKGVIVTVSQRDDAYIKYTITDQYGIMRDEGGGSIIVKKNSVTYFIDCPKW